MTNDDLVFRGPEHSFNVTSPPYDLSIRVADKIVLTFHPDGRVTLSDHLEPDEAARAFLRALGEAFPLWVAALRESKP